MPDSRIESIDGLLSAIGSLHEVVSIRHEQAAAVEARLERLERHIRTLYAIQPVVFALGFIMGKYL